MSSSTNATRFNYEPMAEKGSAKNTTIDHLGIPARCQRNRHRRNPFHYIRDAVVWLQKNDVRESVRSMQPGRWFANDDDDNSGKIHEDGSDSCSQSSLDQVKVNSERKENSLPTENQEELDTRSGSNESYRSSREKKRN